MSPRGPAANPATIANARRNAAAERDRRERWRSARDACWALLDPLLEPGAAIAIVGAGNADDLPLTRLAARAARIDLLDVDAPAARSAIRREPRALRRRLRAIELDVTDGGADAIVGAAVAGQAGPTTHGPSRGIGEPPYDVVIGDLLYSQLLYPGLLDAGVDESRRAATLRGSGPALTRMVVERLHLSAPRGVVVHLHDPAGWWSGHPQPFELGAILDAASESTEAALALLATATTPIGCDPREALRLLDVAVVQTAFWRWPFGAGVDYVVCASVARR